jgi:ABC-2 type transport system ATP-binding protein
VRGLDAAGVVSRGLSLRRPSLDDVFLALTGHAAEDADQVTGRPRRAGRRAKKNADGSGS